MPPITPALPAALTSALTLAGNSPALRAWQVGAVLQAQVVTDTVNNQVTLRIGSTTLEANTQTPLTAGQLLSVEVVKLGEQPVLKVLPLQAPPVAADPMTAALRTALPKQTAVTPLLANLRLLAEAAGGKAPVLPAPILAAAAQIYRALTDSHQAATARGLQQAVRDTGVFLESKLAQFLRDGSAPLGNDFKAALLRLQAALNTATGALAAAAPTAGRGANAPPLPAAPEPAPPLRTASPQAQASVAASLARLPIPEALAELQRQTEGSLARLQLHQLAALPDGPASPPVWLLELPIRHDAQVDLFHLRIARDGPGGSDAPAASRPWSVNLAFDLPGLGAVQARVTILGEQVTTRFWAEQPGTVQAFNQHLDVLRVNLRQAGLEVGDLSCQRGPAPASPSVPRPPLMDFHA